MLLGHGGLVLLTALGLSVPVLLTASERRRLIYSRLGRWTSRLA